MKKPTLLLLALGSLVPLVSCETTAKPPKAPWQEAGLSTQPWNRPNAATDNGTLGSAIGTR